MMSRACAGLAVRPHHLSLPGSEAAVRLAMERLVDPELAHLVQQATRSDSVAVRPFSSTHFARRSARATLRGDDVRPIDHAYRACAARAGRRTRRGRRRLVADRRAAVRASGDGRLRGRRGRHRERDALAPARARLRRSRLHGPDVGRRPSSRGTLRRDRDGRAASRRRRRRRDGGGDARSRGTDDPDSARASPPGRTSDGAAPTSRRRRVVAAGDVLTPSRIGALAAIGCARRRGLRAAARRDSVHGQRNRRAGARAPAGTHLRRQPLHARRCRRRHTAASPEPTAPAHDSVDALVEALDRCAAADLIVFSGGSSVGDRDLIVDAVAARGEMVFHGIAVRPGKPTAFAHRRRRTPFFGMPGNPTSCLSNAYILLVPFLRATRPPAAAPAADRPRAARPPDRVRRRPAPVLHRSAARRRGVCRRSRDRATSQPSHADGYIEIPASQSVVEEGDVVDVTLF